MKSKLSDLCNYVKEKIPVADIDKHHYVSTENMIPDKGGITTAAALPTTENTQAFQKGDILVSNIRPYFRKIWLAEYRGGCSNDVLVFRAKASINVEYLYYVLADDAFFAYATQTSKGTKMPRGDKLAVMEYSVPFADLELQRKIGSILRAIDNKISLNQKINENLEQQVATVYQSWFEEFNLTDGVCPDGWRYRALSSFADISSGKRPPVRSNTYSRETPIPIVGAASVMGFTSEANHKDKILVTGRVGTHGIIQRFNTPCWTSDNTLVITSPYYEFTNQVLRKIDYTAMNRGSTQPLITQGDMKKIFVLVPDLRTLEKFENFAGSLMSKWVTNNTENNRLASLRDALLPKLMSGEIDVEGIEL